MELFAYVIMTNHVHAIMRSKEGMLSGLVRDFKKFSSKQGLKETLKRAGWVANPEDYLYSSARNYADMESLIEIDKI